MPTKKESIAFNLKNRKRPIIDYPKLPKRELFAAMALQTLILRWHDSGKTHDKIAAKQAVEYADALINELNLDKDTKS